MFLRNRFIYYVRDNGQNFKTVDIYNNELVILYNIQTKKAIPQIDFHKILRLSD